MYRYTQTTAGSVESNGCHYYVQPPPPSWADVMNEPQVDFNNSDVFSGMGEWNNQEVMYQSFQYPVYQQQMYSPSSLYGSYQGSSNSLYSMSSGYSSGESTPPPTQTETMYDQQVEVGSPSSPGENVSLKNIKNLSPEEIQEMLQSWKLKTEERRAAGFPELGPDGQVKIEPTMWERHTKSWINDTDRHRKCSRCYQTFKVRSNGDFPIGRNICQYEIKGEQMMHNYHVSNQRFVSELQKFVSTPPPAGSNDFRGRQVYAIDVEMVLTTAGPALARLSVVGFDGKCELDLIVKPEAKVIDTVTKYSGITMGMLERATHTLETCRDFLLELINSDTILIGHGLEGDLKALRLIHHNVIDTSIMYQDEGRNKVALRTLAKQFLNRSIQSDNLATFGHSSEEDALASLDLVKYYLNYC